jgi:plastocyanin
MMDRLLGLRALLFTPLLFFVVSSALSATTFTVTAQGDGYYTQPVFTPSTLQIHAGDTVTFRDLGSGAGGGMHNVHADDDSFQCSVSCSSPNNVPVDAAWSFSQTFTQAGTVSYHCDMHVSQGMKGTITVLPAAASGALAFSSAAYSVSGSAASVLISVTRSGGSSGAVAVHYATSDGSAKAGVDYTAAAGTLSWSDGDTSTKTFPVTILGDGKATSNLTVNLALSSPSGGAALGTHGAAVLTIQETSANPGTINFSQATYTASEASGAATITVNRSGGKSGAVSVHFATAAGTAVAGKNYDDVSGTLSFADGDGAAKTFSVPLIDDHVVAPALTVKLTLSSPTGGAGLGTAAANLDVLDADAGGGPPAAPTALVAAAVDTSSIQLSWNDNSNDEVGFEVQSRALDGSSFAKIATAPAGGGKTAGFLVTGLNPATGYAFQVRAGNASGNSAFTNVAFASTDAVPAPCVADGQTLCLGSSGRFQVKVAYVAPTGSGTGTTVPLATIPDSGLFYFFDAGNIEMLIKVLNACSAPFNHYWVFFAATTNVQFTVTVIDTTSGAVQTYFNPLNQPAAAVQDTSAFATCP